MSMAFLKGGAEQALEISTRAGAWIGLVADVGERDLHEAGNLVFPDAQAVKLGRNSNFFLEIYKK